MSQAEAKRLDKRQSSYLESWRGSAAIMVFLSHGISLFLLPLVHVRTDAATIIHLTTHWLGLVAVAIFFALSGLLIRLSVANHSRSGQFDGRAFVLARIKRILPTFLFALALTGALYWLAPFVFASGSRAIRIAGAGDLIRHAYALEHARILPTIFFYNDGPLKTVSANAPLWTLTYEVWLYAIAWLAAEARRWIGRWPARLIWPVIILISALLLPGFAALAAIWFAGYALCGLFLRDRMPGMLVVNIIGYAGLAAFLLALPLLLMAGVAAEKSSALSDALVELMPTLFILARFARCIMGRSGHILRAGLFTARFGYALYVLHFPILLFFFGIIAHGVYGLANIVYGVGAMLAAFIFAATLGRRVEMWRPSWKTMKKPQPSSTGVTS